MSRVRLPVVRAAGLLLLGLLTAVLLTAGAPTAGAPAPLDEPPAATVDPCGTVGPRPITCPDVLVMGVAGLRWDDVGPQTPLLQGLARDAAVGALSVKALPKRTCRGDGWLTLGAGARAQHFGRDADAPCGSALPTDLGDEAARNARSRDGAVVGLLSAALGGSVPVEGDGARAALPPSAPRGAPTTALRVVDAGTLPVAGDRAAALREVDAEVGRALDRRDGPTDVLVVGLSGGDGSQEESLHLALASGPSFGRGALSSASTGREPYVQLVDVAPTVLALLGRPVPEQMDGQPWRVTGTVPTVAELVDLDRRAGAQRAVTVPFFVTAYAGVLTLLLLALWRRATRAAELVALSGTALLGASYVAGLVPWWRAGLPLVALLAVVVPLSVATAALALAVGRRGRGTSPARPAALVCAAVAVVVLLDLVTGAHLQIDAVAGYSSLVAGRFSGLGNVAFGVLAAAALLATAVLARGSAALAVAAVVVVGIDGAPVWGSDVGGVLALVPAFVLLGLLRSGRRASVLRLAVAGLAGAAVVTAFALADLARPAAERTHLGRFAQDLVDGTAGALLQRKAEAVLGLLFANAVTALLPLLVAAVVYLVARPPGPLRTAFEAAPAWRVGLLAVGLASAVGFAVNDSGAAVPALATCVALPATLAVVLRASRCEGASSPARTAAPVA